MKPQKRARGKKDQKHFEELLGALPEGERVRVQRLEERRLLIEKTASDNQRFSGGLLAEEIDKLKDLVMAFAEIALASSRWQRHLAAYDVEDLESEIRRYELAAKSALDDGERTLARQNLTLLEERKASIGEMRRRMARARAELDLVENTFRLIADQVAVMAHPHEVGERIADLIVGVEAVREMTED